jgi:Ser/Thr protein kinase RdoA (MazF antagonist)
MTPLPRALEERFGLSAVALELVSDTTKPRQRAASYRAQAASGSVYKVRVMPTAEAAQEVAHLHAILRERARPPADGRATIELPRILAHSGRFLITPWIEGRRLSSLTGFEAALGDLLGRIHGCALRAEEIESARGVGCSHELDGLLSRQLDALVSHGLLNRDEAALARRFALAFRPEDAEVGIVHRDLCAANVVLDADDRPWLIDNETMSVRALDHDLGRTWTRAHLTEEGWKAFFSGYRRSRHLEPYFAHFPYWSILACAESASFRAQHWSNGAEAPARRLRTLIAGLARGAEPERLMVS